MEVKAEKISKVNAPGSFQVIDSQAMTNQLTSNLSELLAGEAGLFFKTYGLGSLGTSTLRGGGAGHTVILWNGFNLQNPMNGVADFALFPVWMMDKVSLQRGGGGSLQGSGSIGGAVFIEDKVEVKKGLEVKIGSSVGSFDDFRHFGSLAVSGEKWGSRVKFFHQNAQNDFPLPGKNGLRQQNAGVEQWLISQNNLLKINARHTMESFLWLQKTGRFIPPSITEANTHAFQEDDIARLGLVWTAVGSRAVTKARAGYAGEGIRYFSDLIDTSDSRARTWIGEVERAYFFQKNKLLRIGLNSTQQQANTKETGPRTRSRTAMFASWQQFFWNDKISWTTDARQELTDRKLIPLVVSSGMNLHWNTIWQTHFRISKNYNLPTFNDLYWQDAFARGNPSLQPETASGGELGTSFNKKISRFQVNANLTAFSSHVNNWILWSPRGNIWSPTNKRTVWARGLEGSLAGRTAQAAGDWQFSGNLRWSLTRSTVEKIYEDEDPRLLGKQLIYTPIFSGSAGLTVFYKKNQLTYRHQFTGKRYTTTDNAAAHHLDGFSTGALTLSSPLRFLGILTEIQFSVFNLWNVDYQPLAARPMPGRHFRLEARFGISAEKH